MPLAMSLKFFSIYFVTVGLEYGNFIGYFIFCFYSYFYFYSYYIFFSSSSWSS